MQFKYPAIFARGVARAQPASQRAACDLDVLRARTIKARLLAMAWRALQVPVLMVLQEVWPILRFGKLVVVTRAADIASVLHDSETFRVPFGPEMAELAGGATFVLGLDGAPAERQRAIIRAIVRRDDVDAIGARAESYAEALLDAGKGTIDAQRDLIQRVAAESCLRYFGLSTEDPDAFAGWALACSNLLFADPLGQPQSRALADAGAARLRTLIDRALDAAVAREVRTNTAADETLVDRLAHLHLADPEAVTRDEMRAILLGLVVGFIPTNAMAGGKILGFLARRRDVLQMAREAAEGGRSDPRLAAILLEIMRLDPAIAPGQWRYAPAGGVIRRARGGDVAIASGTTLLVATMTGLRDRRTAPHPHRFDAGREGSMPFVFGDHIHACLGSHVAVALSCATFAALLRRPGIAKALPRVKLGWLGPFPETAPMTYDDPGSRQEGVLIAVPVTSGRSSAEVGAAIDAVSARLEDLRPQIDKTGTIHFAAISVIDVPAAGSSRGAGDAPTEAMILIEINADGHGRDAIERFARAMPAELRALLTPEGLAPDIDIAAWLADPARRVAMHGAAWGATALQYYGICGHCVRDIAREHDLAAVARTALDAFHRRTLGRVANASSALRQVRRVVRDIAAPGDPRSFEAFLLKPAHATSPLADWRVSSTVTSVGQVLRSAPVQKLAAFLLVAALVSATALGYRLGLNLSFRTLPSSVPALVWVLFEGAVIVTLVALIVLGALAAILRHREERDLPDAAPPTLEHVRRLAADEDRPGHVQNHIIVVTPLKRGLFRRLTLAFALWGIGQSVAHWFRPGFILNMGTIHFARWVRLPGRDTMLFQSNYDGSWESYLEDFITRAHWGQTAAWSNCEGFPKSRWLVFRGAEDGDHFKRFVRRLQVPTRFWYSRFPALTNGQIRRNALIRDGLCRARSESEARTWLALFDSAQRTRDTLESDEVQSIVFSGFGQLRHAKYLLLKFAGDPADTRTWLNNLNGSRVEAEAVVAAGSSFLETSAIPRIRIAFGEEERRDSALAIAFSADGLRYLGLDDSQADLGLQAMPGVFRMGMAARAARLGDTGEEQPTNWRWSDVALENGPDGVHAVLCIYGKDAATLDAVEHAHLWFAGLSGITVVSKIAADPLDSEGRSYEHFGFRDGLVQPVIAGSRKAGSNTVADDVVPAGEMLIGYRNAQGFPTPAIPLAAEHDPLDILPDLPREAERFPRFAQCDDDSTLHDFGRNGTFLAVRQLEQHVDSFTAYTEAAGLRLNRDYKHLERLLGGPASADWVAAKMVGRWKSGAPLLGNPSDPGNVSPRPLRFGSDDPMGLQCPLGAHVRRANPRESLEPGDATELGIVNRHRLMRRGRSYTIGDEKGLMFMAICEDLERQFEFVQRSWIEAPGFHDLDQESDPLVGRPGPRGKSFAIPTASGTIRLEGLEQFVSVRAGGYFFLPSRSALTFLAQDTPGARGDGPQQAN